MSLREVIEKQREAIAREKELQAKFEDRNSKKVLEEISDRIRLDMNMGKQTTCFRLNRVSIGTDTDRYESILRHFFHESYILTTYAKNSKGIRSICIDTNDI